ncbi:hypothetical protein [Clostridium sp. KNHs214]|uniref:hypothetical protein n=1 Tax=Clostridium sp. KNHs214 TaxID=1540257 RepID=UPI000557F874|nr:hypothetical protein [Clostridium sp. KNHs214]
MKKYYDGHNPEVWEATPYPFNLSFEEKMELFIKESKEKIKELEMKKHTKRETKKIKERRKC